MPSVVHLYSKPNLPTHDEVRVNRRQRIGYPADDKINSQCAIFSDEKTPDRIRWIDKSLVTHDREMKSIEHLSIETLI